MAQKTHRVTGIQITAYECLQNVKYCLCPGEVSGLKGASGLQKQKQSHFESPL